MSERIVTSIVDCACPQCGPSRRSNINRIREVRREWHSADGSFTWYCVRCGSSGANDRGVAVSSSASFNPKKVDLSNITKAQRASDLWRNSVSIHGTPAERYLTGRGIVRSLPTSLRFKENCSHPKGYILPAMIAKIEGGNSSAVHRTYLAQDGSRKADIAPDKAMLGSAAGGAVRLSPGNGPLLVAEGIETALSFLFPDVLFGAIISDPSASNLFSRSAILAALSTSGLKKLRLPEKPDQLTIAVDGDEPGREAANALAERAALLGWDVSLLRAPDGQDWNDVLIQELAKR